MIYGSKNAQFYSDSKPRQGLQIGTFIKSSAKIRKTHKNINKSTEEYKTSRECTTLDSSKYYSNQVYDQSQGRSSNRKNITFSNGCFKPGMRPCLMTQIQSYVVISRQRKALVILVVIKIKVTHHSNVQKPSLTPLGEHSAKLTLVRVRETEISGTQATFGGFLAEIMLVQEI